MNFSQRFVVPHFCQLCLFLLHKIAHFDLATVTHSGLRIAFIALVLFPSLVWGGSWYVPEGAGKLKKDISTLNRYDTLHIELSGGAYLLLTARPEGRDTVIRPQLVLPDGTSARWSSDKFTISVPGQEGKQTTLIEKVISKFPGESERTWGSLDELEGKSLFSKNMRYVRNFYMDIVIKNFRPREFVLELPSIRSGGQDHHIGTVKFSLRKGVAIPNQLQ